MFDLEKELGLEVPVLESDDLDDGEEEDWLLEEEPLPLLLLDDDL